MNFDMSTSDGMQNCITWTERLFEQIKDGGAWIVPRSGTMIRLNHAEKVAIIKPGLLPDPDIEKVIKAMGWTVKREGE